jgi:hypothetical protein
MHNEILPVIIVDLSIFGRLVQQITIELDEFSSGFSDRRNISMTTPSGNPGGLHLSCIAPESGQI